MVETILTLEKQGITFAPRPYGFDYELTQPLTVEQAESIIRLKERNGEVCRYLAERAKRHIRTCKRILGDR